MTLDVRSRLLWAFSLSLLLASGSLRADDGTRVPADRLDGLRLVHQDQTGRATIAAPASNYHWYSAAAKNGTAYRCQNSMDEHELPYIFLVTPGEPGASAMSESDLRRFEQEFKQGIQQGVGQDVPVARPSAEPSSVLGADSYRFTCEVLFSGATVYGFAYVTQRDKVYSTLCLSLSPTEPAAFTEFSRSLQVQQTAPSSQPASGGTRRNLYAIPIGIGLVVGVWIARRRANASSVPPAPAARRPGPSRSVPVRR